MAKEIHHSIIQHREQGAECREVEAEHAGYSVVESNNATVKEAEKSDFNAYRWDGL